MAVWTLAIFFMNYWLGSQTATERLKSRRPFVPAARKLLQDLTELDIREAQWTDFKWSTEYSECSSDLRAFIPRTSTRPMGMGLPRSSWVRAQPLAGWCWVFSVVHAQMGPCSYIELRVWRCRTNRRTYHSDMPRTSGTYRNTWTDGFGCRHTMLAEYHHCQHLKMWIPPKRKKEKESFQC